MSHVITKLRKQDRQAKAQEKRQRKLERRRAKKEAIAKL
jgi:hypothetical protein